VLKTIVFVTGTRADFGKIAPLARVCVNGGIRVYFFVTGMHMLEQYGLTKEEVREFPGADVFEFINQIPNENLSSVLQKTVGGFGDFIDLVNPDVVFYHGDRVEALAAALVCSTKKVHGSHIEGGELSGTIDEIFRHAITKLSISHFVSSQAAKDIVIKMGERQLSVFDIGSPELDEHIKPSKITYSAVKERYDIEFSDFGIVSLHPVFYETEIIKAVAQRVFSELEKTNKNFIVILPNNDLGASEILSVIEQYKKYPKFRVLPNMRFSYFSILMKKAKLIIGNSSIVVREAPFIGIPSVNIGNRQMNRSTAKSITNLSNECLHELAAVVYQNWGIGVDSDQSFGDGHACERFDAILREQKFWQLPVNKQFDLEL
jgi:UDP-N-acetylglucosamine 2-epimerase (hydrolysing)